MLIKSQGISFIILFSLLFLNFSVNHAIAWHNEDLLMAHTPCSLDNSYFLITEYEETRLSTELGIFPIILIVIPFICYKGCCR